MPERRAAQDLARRVAAWLECRPLVTQESLESLWVWPGLRER